MDRPKFPLTAVSVEISRQTEQAGAVFYTVTFKDQDGRLFQSEDAKFYFDLKEITVPSESLAT